MSTEEEVADVDSNGEFETSDDETKSDETITLDNITEEVSEQSTDPF